MTTAGGHLVLVVIRDAVRAQQADELAALLTAAAVQEAEKSRELLDRVVTGLHHAGLSLQAASGQPAHTAREKISEALQHPG